MNISKILHVTNRDDWRRWLRTHHRKEPEIWLVYYKEETGKPRISYNDAVEEALCFGWIDSIVKSLDEKRFAQRFSPRKPGTSYSQMNRERLRKLIKEKKVIKGILETLKDTVSESENFLIPEDILKAIKKNKDAWEHFQSLSDQYKRIRIGFILGARKRPEEFEKRLNYFIKMTSKNKQFGFGGIKEYF